MENKELNKLVAEKVLGWTQHSTAWFDKDSHYTEEIDNFRPSEKIEDAWYVFEKLRESGKWCCLDISSDYHYVYDIMLTEADQGEGNNPDHKPTITFCTEDICRGICIVALKTKDIEIDL